MPKQSKGRGSTRSRPAIALAAAPQKPEPFVPRAPEGKGLLGEIGISGTVNTDGRPRVEANPDLRDELARGRPGSGTTWGVWEEIKRTDSACQSALNMVIAPLREATVEVEPAEDVPGGDVHAEFVRDNLLEWLDPRWPQFIEQHVDGFLTFGFDIHEAVPGTRADKRVAGGTAVYVRKLAQRLPSSLHSNPWRELDGELVTIVQSGARVQQSGGKLDWAHEIHLPASSVLLTTWQRSGGNYGGFSAMRSVYFLAKLRKALLTIFSIGSEREALGVPLASVDKDAPVTEAQLTAFQAVLEQMCAHENAAIVAPKGVSLDWIFSPISNKGHVLDAWERLGKAIHQVFQTQQMTLGVDGTGSRAVGEVHDASKNDFIGGVRALVESTLNGVGERPYTGLASKLVQWNFGPQAKYPRIKLVLKRASIPLTEIAQAVPALTSAGYLTPTVEDENAIRDRLGWAPIDPAVRDAERARKASVAAAISGARPDEDDDDEKPAGEDAEKARNGPPPAGPAFRKMSRAVELSASRRKPGDPFRRELFAWEQHLALADIEQTLAVSKERFEQQARAFITSAVAEKLPEIRDAMKDGDPSEVAGIQLDLSKLDQAAGAFIQQQLADGYRRVAQERRAQKGTPLADDEPRLHLEEGDDRTAPKPDPEPAEVTPAPTPAQIRAQNRVQKLVQSMRSQLLTRVRAGVVADIESEARYLVRTGGDPEQIVANVVNAALETRGLKFAAGSVQAEAFSMGREEFAREHGSEVEAVRFSAILDSGTCLPCNGEDGKRFEFGSPEHDAHVPPYGECRGGDNCRCLLTYEFKSSGFTPVEEVPEA